MSCEGSSDKSEDQKTGIPEDQNTRRPFNVYAANRSFERSLFFSNRGPLPRVHVPEPGDRIIAKMIFDPDTGEEKIVRFDDPDFDKY